MSNLKIEDIKIGKWYMLRRYGYSDGIKAKVIEICEDYVIVKFYWGEPFRSRKVIHVGALIGECKRPCWFSNH